MRMDGESVNDLRPLITALGLIIGIQLLLTTVSISGALATAAATVAGCACYLQMVRTDRP